MSSSERRAVSIAGSASGRAKDNNNAAHDVPRNGSSSEHGADPSQSRVLHWWNPAPTLENSGSVARDHLANERTWLAYLRTSLSIASAGVALVQLFTISNATGTSAKQLRRFVRPLGATVVILGWVVLIIGGWRYVRVQFLLQTGKFPPARRTVGLLSAALATVVAVTFGFLLALAK